VCIRYANRTRKFTLYNVYDNINVNDDKNSMRVSRKLVAGLLLLGVLVASPLVYAATSPSLGIANTFAVLSSTYTNTVAGTTINGDVGYTTPPAVTPTINGTTHVADSTYNQAGIDQNTTLTALNSQPCTFSFAPGAIDLASDSTHGTIGVYAPGVYCIVGAADIGGGGTITLTGGGTYIFRMTGALNSSANSIVALSGASACDVWWTPGAATTLGANSTFAGIDIDASGITIGNLAVWSGKALAFGGTVTTSRNTITIPAACANAVASNTPKTPGLPNTGAGSGHNSVPLWAIPAAVLIVSSAIYIVRKKA
jgi:LPXTG-motif cell wall-anchored protein